MSANVEPHVFPSKTHPGQWFWLAADGKNGWASDQATAERRAGITRE
ncbi:hypothetical protein [Arthrobacter sp. efr-133-TYG-118]|nr:hypothetical protein [Arthrobacter sp. efr-133-TYG-118]